MLIGQGKMENILKTKILNENLENKVIIIGQKKNIENYYQIMDVFALPSLYEGLGMVLIEAQVSGVPCIASNYVPRIVKMTDEFKFLSIDSPEKDKQDWCDAILNFRGIHERKNSTDKIEKYGYNIKKEAIKLEKNIHIQSGDM